MLTLIMAAVTFAVLGAMSLRADTRLSHVAELPTQWLLNGTVVRRSPRRVALSLIPGVATLIMAGLSVLALTMTPRPGQEGLLVPATFALALLFIGLQALYVGAVERHQI